MEFQKYSKSVEMKKKYSRKELLINNKNLLH